MSDAPVKDLPAKRSLIVWRKHGLKLLSVGAALIALITSLIIRNNAEQMLLTSKSSLQQQQNINVQAAQSALLLNQYLTPYRALQVQGVIAHPKRLQWLETLQDTVNHHLIPTMSFVLSPTATANATNTTYMHETLAVKVTPMRIEFALLHEGDLYRLMRDIRSHSEGLYSAENCEIMRSEEESAAPQGEIQSSQSNAGFKGYCHLLWYSLADITSAWEVPSAP